MKTFLFLLIVAVVNLSGSESNPSTRIDRKYTNILGKISDFRFFHSDPEIVNGNITKKECFVDVLGRVVSTNGTIVRSQAIACETLLNVGSVLDHLSIDIDSLKGVQLRIFKRNEIHQRSRFFETRPKEEAVLMRKLTMSSCNCPVKTLTFRFKLNIPA